MEFSRFLRRLVSPAVRGQQADVAALREPTTTQTVAVTPVSDNHPDWCGCKEEEACDDCSRRYLQRTRANRQFSGNKLIDEFIWKSEDMYPRYHVEWIPHEHLKDVKHLADGGFSTVYYAMWNYSYIKWNDKDQIEMDQRVRKKPVAIKYLKNSTGISKEFMHEVII